MGTLNTTNLNVTGNWSSAPAGTIIQMQSTEAGPARQAIASLTPVGITDLSINFTPKNSTSKIMIQVYLNANCVLMLPVTEYLRTVLKQLTLPHLDKLMVMKMVWILPGIGALLRMII